MSRPNMIPCASCGLENNILSRKQQKEFNCFNCGADLQLAIEKYDHDHPEIFAKEHPEPKNTEQKEIKPKIYKGQSEVIESKYPALSTVSTIYKLIAVLIGIAAFIGLFYGISMLDEYGGKQMGIVFIAYSILAGFLGVVSLLAISEGIKLFIDIEKNTFRQNSLIEKLINKIK